MLKIRDGVDLKELEKYGFRLEEDYCGNDEYANDDGLVKYYTNGSIIIFIYPTDDRRLTDGDFGYSTYDGDVLYDLIKADLVEKVK